MSEVLQYFHITKQTIITSQLNKFFDNKIIYNVESSYCASVNSLIKCVKVSCYELILGFQINSNEMTTIYVTSGGYVEYNIQGNVISKFTVMKGTHTYFHIIFDIGHDVYLAFINDGVINEINVSKIDKLENVTLFLNTLNNIGEHEMYKKYQSVETFINNVKNMDNTIIVISDMFNPKIMCEYDYHTLDDYACDDDDILILHDTVYLSPQFDRTRLNEIKKRCFQILPMFNEYMLTDLWGQLVIIMNIII